MKIYSMTNLMILILHQECYYFLYNFGQSSNRLTSWKMRIALFYGQREYQKPTSITKTTSK
jgi:hypothetical protein